MTKTTTQPLNSPPNAAASISVRVMSLLVSALPWLIIVALLLAGIFIRPQPVGTTLAPPALESRDQFYGVTELASGEILAVGTNGKLLKFRKGESPVRIELPTRQHLQDIASWPNGRAVAVGNDGVVLVSRDAGQNWQLVEGVPRSEVANKLNRVRVAADGVAVATGEMGALLISRDYGASWSRLREEADIAWNDVALLADGNVVVVGEFGRVLRGNINSGEWADVDAGVAVSLMSLTFANDTRGVAVGLEGTVIETVDGGLSWSAQAVGISEHLFDVAWLADKQQWFVTGALGRFAVGSGDDWQADFLDKRNLAWHVRAQPAKDGLWLAGATIGHWDGASWTQLQP